MACKSIPLGGRKKKTKKKILVKNIKNKIVADVSIIYQRTLGVAALHRLGQERFAVAVRLTAHGRARVERRPLAADRVHRTVENATLFLVTRATLSVFGAGHDHVVGARGRGGALDFAASAARRRLVAVTRTARPVFPAIVHLL